ncbi:calponin homology domain-containing protein DDB_G0272472-like [Ptychodera flava]|uniref:calponin homology domain-containing protein DDB_G0272472-like n=1 Tax=Ptychodera flava TaxID=63121 RepID=UPI00396A1E17
MLHCLYLANKLGGFVTMAGASQDGNDDWSMTDEERTRYDALFYSQNPVVGLLTGEKARDLFLRSKLPLQALSQIWKLCDVNHDNMLNADEFSIAMHLISHKLRGKKMPAALPECLIPKSQPESEVPGITEKEREAYRQVFQKNDKNMTGYISAACAREIFLSSKLPVGCLAQVWNLSDIDRDGQLDSDEFAIALHLLRFLRRGNQIDGSINVLEILPDKLPSNSVEAKRRRIAEVEIQKQKLSTVKEQKRLEMEREAKRVELEREKIRLNKMKIEVQKEKWSREGKIVQLSDLEQEEKSLTTDLKNLQQLENSLRRLAIANDKMLQEEFRLNLEEERLLSEKRLLEKEADEVRQEAARNKLHREIDPFHSLHEKRKDLLDIDDVWAMDDQTEERKKGIIAPLSSPDPAEPEAPFQKTFSESTNLSGKDLFSGSTSVSPTSAENIFEDNFVDSCETSADFSVEFDTEFKTVSVTAEEDDLWSSAPVTNQNELFKSAPGTSPHTTNDQHVPCSNTPTDKLNNQDEINDNIPDVTTSTNQTSDITNWSTSHTTDVTDQSANQTAEITDNSTNQMPVSLSVTRGGNGNSNLQESTQKIDPSELSQQLTADNSGWEDFFATDNTNKPAPTATTFDLLGDTAMDGSVTGTTESGVKQSDPFGMDDDDFSFYITQTEEPSDNSNIGQLIDFGEPEAPPQLPKSGNLPFYMTNDFDFQETTEKEPREKNDFGFEISDKSESSNMIDFGFDTTENSFSFDNQQENEASNTSDLEDVGESPKLPTSAPPTKDETPSYSLEELPPDFYSQPDVDNLATVTVESPPVTIETKPQKEDSDEVLKDDASKEELVVHTMTTDYVQSYEPKVVTMEPKSVTMEPESVTMEPESVTMEPESVTMEPKSVTMESKSVPKEPKSVTMKPKSVTMEPKSVSTESKEVTMDTNVDEQPIDRDALIRQWEMSLSINSNPAEQDLPRKQKHIQPSRKKLNVYVDPNPKFKKKETPKESEEDQTTVIVPKSESDLQTDTMNIIAMQRAKKGKTQLAWNLENKEGEELDRAGSSTLESLKQYEERKKKQKEEEGKAAPLVSGKLNNVLTDSRDSGLGDTWKSLADDQASPETSDPIPVNRQNGGYQPVHEVDTSNIDKAALLQQWNDKMASEDTDDLEAQKEKERRIREEIQKDVDSESIASPAKTRMEWEKRLSLRKGVAPPQFSHVSKYSPKTPKEEDEKPPERDIISEKEKEEDEVDVADVQEPEAGYHDDVREEEIEPEEVPMNESIVEREIRLQRQKERQLQKELNVARRLPKKKVVTPVVDPTPVTTAQVEDVRPQEEFVPPSAKFDDSEEDDQQRNVKLSQIEREIQEQLRKEEELLRQGRVKNVSTPSFGFDEESESDAKPKRMESIIEREMREQRKKEELLRLQRGLPVSEPGPDLYVSTDDSQPSFNEDEVSPRQQQEPITETVTPNSYPVKERPFSAPKHYASQSPVSASKNIFERRMKPARAEGDYHSGGDTPKKAQQKTKEVILVEQEKIEEKTYEEEKVKPEFIDPEIATEYESAHIMEEPEKESPPPNESIIEREIRLQREREEELQKQRRRAGIVKSSVNSVPEEKKTNDVAHVNAVETKSFEPVSQQEQKLTPAQARAVFSKPTKIPDDTPPSRQRYGKANAAGTPTRDVQINNLKESNKVSTPTQNGSVVIQEKEDTVEKETTKKETPIEREIRLAREKELSYRKERGLLQPRHEKQHIASKKKTEPVEETPRLSVAEYQPPESAAKDQYMRKAAGYYFEKDIEENRRKEEQLQKEGKIRRLSTRSNEDERNAGMSNGPKHESVVEREIRLQKEREETFKRERDGSSQHGRPTDLSLGSNASSSGSLSPQQSPIDSPSSEQHQPLHVPQHQSQHQSQYQTHAQSPPQSQSQPHFQHHHKPGYAQYMTHLSQASVSLKLSPGENHGNIEEVDEELEETSQDGSVDGESKESKKPVKRKSLLASQWEDKFK